MISDTNILQTNFLKRENDDPVFNLNKMHFTICFWSSKWVLVLFIPWLFFEFHIFSLWPALTADWLDIIGIGVLLLFLKWPCPIMKTTICFRCPCSSLTMNLVSAELWSLMRYILFPWICLKYNKYHQALHSFYVE